MPASPPLGRQGRGRPEPSARPASRPELIAAAKAQTATYKAELEAPRRRAGRAAGVGRGARRKPPTPGGPNWTAELQRWATDAAARAVLGKPAGPGHPARARPGLESIQRIRRSRPPAPRRGRRLRRVGWTGGPRRRHGALGGAAPTAGRARPGRAVRRTRSDPRQNQAAWEPPLGRCGAGPTRNEANYEPGAAAQRWSSRAEPRRTGDAIHTRSRAGAASTRRRSSRPSAGSRRWPPSCCPSRSTEAYQNLGGRLARQGPRGPPAPMSEMRPPHELLRGDRVEGAVGAIHSAICGGRRRDGCGQPDPALPDARRAHPRGRRRYQLRYGVTLEAELRDQWSCRGSEADETHGDRAQRPHRRRGHRTAAHRDHRARRRRQPDTAAYRGAPQRLAIIDREAAAEVYAQIRRRSRPRAPRTAGSPTRSRPRSPSAATSSGLSSTSRPRTSGGRRTQPGRRRATQAAFSLASPAGRDLLQGAARLTTWSRSTSPGCAWRTRASTRTTPPSTGLPRPGEPQPRRRSSATSGRSSGAAPSS